MGMLPILMMGTMRGTMMSNPTRALHRLTLGDTSTLRQRCSQTTRARPINGRRLALKNVSFNLSQ